MLIPHKPSRHLHSNTLRAQRRRDDTSDVHVTVVPWRGPETDTKVARQGKRTGRTAAINRQPPA